MSTQTTNLKLIKPEMSDYANITDISNNFDILDKAYGDLNSEHADIRAKITSDINAHNSSGTSHADIRRMFNNYLPLTGGRVSGRTYFDSMLSVGQSSGVASNIRVDGAAGNAYIALLNYNNVGNLLIDGYFNNPETAAIDVTNRTIDGKVRYRSTLIDGKGNAKFANEVYAKGKLLATNEYVDGKKWGSTSIVDSAVTPAKLDRAYLPLTGGTMTGNINSSNATGLSLQGATSWANGAAIELRARTDTSNYKGCLILDANLNNDQNRLIIKPNGVITCNRNVTLQAKDGTGLYAKTDGSCGISNGTTTFEFGIDNNFYFNGGRIAKIFNLDYSDIRKFDVSSKPNMSYLSQGEYSLQIFQDKQSLWSEMYVLVWNTSGDRWLKFKSPISWRNQEGTFIVTSVGRITGYDNHSDNACTWIDNNTFYMYSRGDLYQMYHFAGYASAIFGAKTADLFEIDETTEKMTVQTNARAELQSINNKLQDLQAASVSATSIDGEDTYTIYKDGQVVEMNYEQLNNYHDTLTDRRAELLDILKV